MWGVLEHVNNPLALLKYAVKFLKKWFFSNGVSKCRSMLMSYIMKNKFHAPRYLEKGRHLFFLVKNLLKF